MAKLKIELKETKANLKKLSKSVYKILNQKDNLKAELVFVSTDRIQQLNEEFRKVDKPTDVLSFPNLDGIRGKVLDKKDYPNDCDGKYLMLGSIAICTDVARKQAEEIGHSLDRELVYLTLHGLLHLFGYDHETDEDKKQMREIEKQVVAILGFNQ